MPQKHLARWDKFLVYRYESTDDRIYFRDLRAQDLRWYPLLAFHRPETLYEWVRQPGGGISTYMRISDLVGVATDIPAIQAKGHKSAYREAMTKKYRR